MNGQLGAWCARSEMTGIRCRNARTLQAAEQNIACSLTEGMICIKDGEICADYEYQIECTCMHFKQYESFC